MSDQGTRAGSQALRDEEIRRADDLSDAWQALGALRQTIANGEAAIRRLVAHVAFLEQREAPGVRPEGEPLLERIRRLAHWQAFDDIQALRTRLASIGAACVDHPPARPLGREAQPDPKLSELLELVGRIAGYVDACQLYGPADALRDTTRRALRLALDIKAAVGGRAAQEEGTRRA